MKIACAGCGSELEVTLDLKGCKLQCEECEQKFLLPETDEELLSLVVDGDDEPNASTPIRKQGGRPVASRRRTAQESFSWPLFVVISLLIGLGAALILLGLMYAVMQGTW